ncbi:DUF7344 domain-containing protein [Haloarcula salinisoli]|uniref:DUF7344 domain-containing protein n=1 Tax=Haloarcula salinisoli TaxID=2487746 RepID=A0A8J7YB70_9EURY|nr:hypothetical protein [Halomicroarcula salinisoli]MBX0286185.1 hypothetical protein [Halomicroarcula salinisoli]MBX0302327.1 hypothetical protein [Halomicroarcula salinisoli]
MTNDRSTMELEAAVGQGNESVSPAVAEVLSEPYNRYVLRYLHEHPTARVEELVDVVFGAEVAESDSVATPANREPVCFSLRNTVLPELDERDYVDFDPDEQTVARADVPEDAFTAMGIDE